MEVKCWHNFLCPSAYLQGGNIWVKGSGEVSLVCAPAARVERCCGIVRLGPSTHAISRRLLPAFERSTQEDWVTGWTKQIIKMGKMKKGKSHHWYKEEKDKVPKKSYVPTGETTWLGYFSNNGFCPQESLEVVQRRLLERQNPSTCPQDYQEAESQDRRMPPKNKISTDSSVPSIIVDHNSVSKFIK